MSYKTYVNDTQIFGNNESYPEWIAYIKSKGIEVGENDSYTGELDNFMEALDVIESIVMKLEKERRAFHLKSIFDLGEIYNAVAAGQNDESLLDKEIEYVDNAYMFLPYAFLKACENVIEYTGLSFEGKHMRTYKLKDGCKIKVTAG